MPTTNPIKRSNRIALIAAVLALGAVVLVAKTSSRPLSDPQFAVKAAQSSYAEVELGRLAAQKGQSETVRAFGQRMATDHAKAKQKLERIAAQENKTMKSFRNCPVQPSTALMLSTWSRITRRT